jgi:hypothetical protein
MAMSIVSEARLVLTQRKADEEHQQKALRDLQVAQASLLQDTRNSVRLFLEELKDIPNVEIVERPDGVFRIERYRPGTVIYYYSYLRVEFVITSGGKCISFSMIHNHKDAFCVYSLKDFKAALVEFTADHLLEP